MRSGMRNTLMTVGLAAASLPALGGDWNKQAGAESPIGDKREQDSPMLALFEKTLPSSSQSDYVRHPIVSDDLGRPGRWLLVRNSRLGSDHRFELRTLPEHGAGDRFDRRYTFDEHGALKRAKSVFIASDFWQMKKLVGREDKIEITPAVECALVDEFSQLVGAQRKNRR